ncbi:fucose isomerase [Virgibacillus halodenitrificans]|jgi:L-fucose mutarotase|uniref:RbsD/FucU family protein n=1 Tax=Virgibacillus halodenitrificans TaxID=1482 RepID=UPI001FB26F1D|nr:RbsD/FucU domain-containing protein [Virgibacillus halodenitrificans]MCJ0929659.1 fucose isomerase [Virgibacillus halodenitrificans]
MLKGIPANISPELMKTLMEMGHGDEIVISDGNFPASNLARKLVRADGHPIPELLCSILDFFPLDTFVPAPVTLMQTVNPDEERPAIWDTYSEILSNNNDFPISMEQMERMNFYERAKKAYAIIATSESSLYANIILKKGVI